jgi:hypothetical protein
VRRTKRRPVVRPVVHVTRSRPCDSPRVNRTSGVEGGERTSRLSHHAARFFSSRVDAAAFFVGQAMNGTAPPRLPSLHGTECHGPRYAAISFQESSDLRVPRQTSADGLRTRRSVGHEGRHDSAEHAPKRATPVCASLALEPRIIAPRTGPTLQCRAVHQGGAS